MDPTTEQYFILRVPAHMQSSIDEEISVYGRPNCTIECNPTLKFKYKNEEYDIHKVKLPTAVEVVKTFEEQQFYKTGDVSTLLIVGEEPNEIVKNSGLTPPMRFVKQRRFRKYERITELGESIDSIVESLLEKDSKAIEVGIQFHTSAKEEKEIDIIAGEIEAGLLEKKVEKKKPEVKVEIKQKSAQETELDRKIKDLENKISICVNPIIKKRFKDTLDQLIAERDKIIEKQNDK